MKHTFNTFFSIKKQSAYSIVEWMIVIVLSLFLTVSLLSVFVSSKRATTESLSRGERQENAAFAMQILTRDLKPAYFFAQLFQPSKKRLIKDLVKIKLFK